MMKRSLWLMAVLLVMSAAVHAEAIYRWIDNGGVVHYSDVPVPDADRLEVSDHADGAQAEVDLPYETRRAMLNFPVTLYTGNGCGELCTTARTFLQKRGIPFLERVLRSRDEITAFTKLTGKNIVPSIAIGRTMLGGYEATLWNKELDIAGYPKTAPYRPLAPVPDQSGAAEPDVAPAASSVPEIPVTQ